MRISDWSSDVCSSDLLLFVAAPEKLGEKELFAIDQFLMKGGTVVLAASPFVPTFAQGFAARKVDTGLEDWLAHHGITIEESMVLDSQSAALPVPVEREVGGVRVRALRTIGRASCRERVGRYV